MGFSYSVLFNANQDSQRSSDKHMLKHFGAVAPLLKTRTWAGPEMLITERSYNKTKKQKQVDQANSVAIIELPYIRNLIIRAWTIHSRVPMLPCAGVI